MDEEWFWGVLARCITGALKASRDNKVRYIWVDCFILGSQELQGDTLSATAYVEDNQYVEYRVSIALTKPLTEAYHAKEWGRLLPDPDSSDWLTINRAEKTIHIRTSTKVGS